MATDPDNKVIIAVDFGTTFSGAAWAQVSNPEKHFIINQWPYNATDSLDGMTSEKVPSEIAYQYGDSGPKYLWGFQIPQSMPRHQWLKLGLSKERKLGLGSRLSCSHQDIRRIPGPYHSSSEALVVDYLSGLRDHIFSNFKRQIGSSFDDKNAKFIITVPAIWSDHEKMKTLSCAEKAGFGGVSQVRVISEPEAAAMHSLHTPGLHGLKSGDTVVLCDAGGGTVDLITFSIVEMEPIIRLKEEAPGDGGLCGSTFLDRRFEEFLTEKLSSLSGWGFDTLEEAMARFETVAKRTFSGSPNDPFMFPVPGLSDNEEIGIRRGRLQLMGDQMFGLFTPVLEEVYNLVKGQVRISSKKVKAIFLVGGFGQSPFLLKFLREKFSPDIEVLVPPDGWTAVVRGALLKALGEMVPSAISTSVVSRVARKHYGTTKAIKFMEGVHNSQKKYWNYFHGEYHIQVMEWFIKKGDSIRETVPVITTWHERQLKSNGAWDSIQVTLYELDSHMGKDPPLYFNRSMKKHADLNPPLSKIQKGRLPIVKGTDGEDYYHIQYEIHAAYFSAHCQYSLWYEGVNHGDVKVDYV
ncbi:actin-like ATPase domain-containing protein [Aspergillus campestris IBT 28561]|uniref:Actin-like ATPase domain-containing protein n=1 Tax=Aspergillus campestris (strain IBT 28561) TaxID=1392248 RepID=A0A2I1CYZ7_ASPC2|nr:actin-like ATPase domain-containing protein [Aspergillus campestris IBT 28561]PKY02863.1 actin-like ATPase domain-containing protein [Aspergillus campestris IBT 28561]